MTTPTDPAPEPEATGGPAQPVPPPPAPDPGAATPPPPPPPPGSGHVLPEQQQPGGPVPAVRQSDETLWAVLAHLSYFVIPLIGPLVIMLAVGEQRPFARANAVEALNFHLTLLFAALVALVLVLVIVGVVLLIALDVWGLVLTILAAVKSGQGLGYRYPLTIRLVS